MTLSQPLPFAEALQSSAIKSILPTDLNHQQLMAIQPKLKAAARFSAKTNNAHYLNDIDQVIDRILNPRTVVDETGQPHTEGLDFASARQALREKLDGYGYNPNPDEAGSITDLASDARLNLVIKTNVQMAQGFGQFAQGQDQAVLDQWPCTELRRAEDREVPRGTKEGIPDEFWQAKWESLGGTLYDGRMVCRKGDPIMERVSDFGLPYGPPGFNSGYDWFDVTRAEAVKLGVIEENERVRPTLAEFQMPEASGKDLSKPLMEALLEDLGPGHKFSGGVLTMFNEADPSRIQAVNEIGRELLRLIANAKSDTEGGVWRTIHGSHVFIKAGQDVGEAIKEHFSKKNAEKSAKEPEAPKGSEKIAAARAETIKLKKTSTRAFTGEMVSTKTKLSKQESGVIGERVVIAHLHAMGLKDAKPLNSEAPNFPVDMLQNHGAIEVKTGLVSNGKSAQQWRATIGQPGKEETALLKKMSDAQKEKHNLRKQQAILDRKASALKTLEKKTGKKFKGRTITTIINPDTRTADIYEFDGFHLRIPWNSPQAKSAYVGSYKY